MSRRIERNRFRAGCCLSAGLIALAISGTAAAASSSTLLNLSNNQNWTDPAWGEVTIEDSDFLAGDGGIKFTVNLCDNESPQCSSGASSDYSSLQNTIEQFGFGFGSSLDDSNVKGLTDWALETTSTMDGFGEFLYSLDAGNQASTGEPLVFWIVRDNDSIADYASIGSTGGQPRAGSLFAVKVAANKAGAFIGGGSVSEVPIPGTLGLLGMGVAALGMIRRKASAPLQALA